ncbi:MAG: ABC transporter ATP-binding protein/permease [bacterium]|nr:ABC transporter ATP-binding protein/permease [bacterium]
MEILFTYLKKYWQLSVLVLILAAINQIFSLLDPYIFRLVIDNYATKFDEYTLREFLRGVSYLLLLAVGVAFVSRVAKNFQDYYLNTITQRIGAELYADGVKHSLNLPYQIFEDQRSGETLNILQKTRTDVERLLVSAINITFISLVGFIFVTIYAASLYWGVALAYGLTIPIIGSISYFLSNKVKVIQQQIVKETAVLAGSTTESLRNIELVKSLGLADQEIGRLNTTTNKILGLELKKLRFVRSISFVQGTLINLLRTIILLFMLGLVFLRVITFGEFFSLFVYSFFVFGPLQEIGVVINSYREAQVSLKRYTDILAIPVEPIPNDAQPLSRVETLEFRNVSFSYKNAKVTAVENLSFEIKKGETVAFVGPSGSGKTSVVKLLVGLYQPTSGTILYNDISGSKIDLRDLRSQIGFVTQDTQLFAGTIRENLLFVNPNATDEECLDVLHKSACDSLLARADNGLDTVIGEGGVKISGGEKQRLSIARALLRKPTILVFDEATSSLDSLTEEEITKTVRSVTASKNHLAILVAHRLSTIMHADKINVLEKGILAETGTHSELLEKKGLYYAMWRQQIGERV